MRSDYQPYWNELKKELVDAGFNGSVVTEDELISVINLKHGWVLSFECEQYYAPTFTISIAPVVKDSKIGKGYAVHLLMKVFEGKLQQSKQLPTIKNQVHFLEIEHKTLFENFDFYSESYAKLNFIV